MRGWRKCLPLTDFVLLIFLTELISRRVWMRVCVVASSQRRSGFYTPPGSPPVQKQAHLFKSQSCCCMGGTCPWVCSFTCTCWDRLLAECKLIRTSLPGKILNLVHSRASSLPLFWKDLPEPHVPLLYAQFFCPKLSSRTAVAHPTAPLPHCLQNLKYWTAANTLPCIDKIFFWGGGEGANTN